MSGQFRVTIWDPTLIIAQIIAVQSLFYLSYGFLLTCASSLLGANASLTNVFNYDVVNVSKGFLSISCYIVNSLAGAGTLWIIVRRTKQCLDFTVTCYGFHLLFCWLYNGYFPSLISWWLVTLAGISIMCVSAEFLCLKTELEDIPLLGARIQV